MNTPVDYKCLSSKFSVSLVGFAVSTHTVKGIGFVISFQNFKTIEVDAK